MSNLYIIPVLADLKESQKLAETYQAAFEYNDFFKPDFLDQKAEIEKTIALYNTLGRDTSLDTLHGAFFDVTIHSFDKLIRQASEYRINQSLDIASRLGCRGVIFHTNFIPNFTAPFYLKQWVELNSLFFHQAAEKYNHLDIYMENMFDTSPILLKQLAEEMSDCKTFGVCFDIAHANLSPLPIEEWFESLAPYTRHVHINDNFKDFDSHNVVGNGSIDWNAFHKLIAKHNIKPSVLVEVNTVQKQKESLSYMEKNKIYPF